MTNDVNKEKFTFLIENNIPNDCLFNLIAGSQYLEHFGGISRNSYWNSNKFDNRDEMFVVYNSYLSMYTLPKNINNKTDKRLKFDVAYLFQFKSVSQTVTSIDLLAQNNCYADCYSLIRTLLSKLNFLILFSINPDLHQKWLENPKSEIFLDGKIRQELNNNGIYTAPYLYELTSEIIHGQYEALNDIGYLSEGLFAHVKPIQSQIYVLTKFIIGFYLKIIITMYRIDYGSDKNQIIEDYETMFDWLLQNYLVHNRIDHFFVFMAEDRHWEKVGKDTYSGGGSFNYEEFEEQLKKFHKNSQPKKLSKKYY